MSVQYSTTHRNNALADLTTQLGTTPYLLIYTGAPPANCATGATGTLLASLACSNPFAPAPVGGVLTASSIPGALTVTGGTAGYWRLCTSNAGSTVVAQGTIATSGGDINFAGGVVFASGTTVNILSLTITANGA